MSENAPAAPSRRRAYFIAAGIAFTALAVFLHFRDDSAPPPCPFPLPPRDEAAERRYAEAAREFKAATAGMSATEMDGYDTELSTARLALLGFEPARRDIAESAKHLAAAKALLSIREPHFSPPTPGNMSPDEFCSVKGAALILTGSATQAFVEKRPDDAVALLETFGPHRLETKHGNTNFINGLTLVAALAAERECATLLAYADTDAARIRRLLTVVEATLPPEGLFKRSLIGEFLFTAIATQNLSYFGQDDLGKLLRQLPASKSPPEAIKVLQQAWFALNTLPNATCYSYSNTLVAAAAAPEPAPMRLPEYSFFDCNMGRNCGGIRLHATIARMFPMIRDRFGFHATAQTALARAALAIRLYELTHGKRPDTLAALAPDILSAVPIDPYDGQPVRYEAAKGRLWCLGKDLKDDAGDSAKDIVLHLPGCEPPDAESVFDQEKRRKAASAPDTKTP